ncbi:MAG: AAA family ATPase [Proteobacteria bacterium]|nr:AAA family ATPase [Pseudomonadota bacterium]
MNDAKQLDETLENLIYRLRTPLYWVTRRRYVPRVEPTELFDDIDPSIDIERDPVNAFDQATMFRAAGRMGLYGIALAQAGYGGHPTACLVLAGLMIQRAIAPECTNRRSLLARAIGWLSRAGSNQFDQLFGTMEKQLRQILDANDQLAQGVISETRRDLERLEGKVTVVRREIANADLKNLGKERYQRLNLPFTFKGKITKESKNEILNAMRIEYPWAEDLISEIEHRLSLGVSSSQPWLKLTPLLIVGPPGVGKTRFVRRLSELTAVPHFIVSAAGASDNRDFAGTARGWASAHPSRIAEIIIDADCANPIVIVDEVDKFIAGSRNGNILQTMLSMLAPETNQRFRDEGLNVELDLSHVNWLLIANDTRNLDWPLLSRLKTMPLPNPLPQHAEGLVDFILKETITKLGSDILTQDDLDPEVCAALVRAARSGASPRTIAAMVEKSVAIKIRWQRKRLH